MENGERVPVESPEKPKLEIMHQDGYDIVLPNRNPELLVALPGILDSIKTFSADNKEKVRLDDFDSEDYFRDFKVNGIKYFMKQKWATPERLRTMAAEGGHMDIDKQDILTFSTILNEFRMAPTVRQILSSKKVEELIKETDASGISLIEPILGAVNRETGQKFMVYPYVEMHTLFKDDQRSEEDKKMEDFYHKLEITFKKLGIDPNDLAYSHLLRDDLDPKKLYLLDIEGYRKISD